MKKKNALIVSGLYAAMLAALFVVNLNCNSSWCRIHDRDPLGGFMNLFMPLLPVLFFTLLTYRMKDEIFRHWMKFAIWATPLLMVLTLLIMISANNGLGVEGAIGGGFDALLIGTCYAIYVVVSLWRIISAHRKSKAG